MQFVWQNSFNIQAAANQYGTPFYCYDVGALSANYTLLKENLPSAIEVFYSIKANPNIAICQQLQQLGSCAEICSYYEIMAAIKAGFSPKNMIFVGPAKSNKEIIKCLKLGVYAIICESFNEFIRISAIAKQLSKIARIALRINPSFAVKSAPLKMGGKPSQFGMDEEIVLAHKKDWLNNANIKIVGIHVYNGTRILDAESIIGNTQYILNLSERLQKYWKIGFEMVDIGGGLGVPYFSGENALDLAALKKGLTPILNNYVKTYPNSRIMLESGRYLVASAGVLVSRILDIKTSKGETFLITDGGMHCHMAAVGMGSFVKRNFIIELIKNQSNALEKIEKYNITGPLCTPGDLIGKQVVLPKAQIGDLILIKNSGAYGPTASPVMFLSHGFPTELLYQANQFHLVRQHFTQKEFFNNQYLIQQGDNNA